MEPIILRSDDEELECYVVSQTVLGGKTYILTSDSEDGDGEAMILRDDSAPDQEEALYTVVEDKAELRAAAEVFRETLEGIDIED